MHNITKVDNSNQLNNLKLYKTSHKKFISINDEYKFSFNSIEVLNYNRFISYLKFMFSKNDKKEYKFSFNSIDEVLTSNRVFIFFEIQSVPIMKRKTIDSD